MHLIFDRLAEELKRREIRTMLIGGHALQGYGYVRSTLDTDWMISRQDEAKIRELLNAFGYQIRIETPQFIQFTHTVTGLIDLDVMLVEPRSFDAMYADSRAHAERGHEWRIPGPKYFIALKLHALKNNPDRKGKDGYDIQRILEHSRDEIDRPTFQKICNQYGPDGIFDELWRDA